MRQKQILTALLAAAMLNPGPLLAAETSAPAAAVPVVLAQAPRLSPGSLELPADPAAGLRLPQASLELSAPAAAPRAQAPAAAIPQAAPQTLQWVAGVEKTVGGMLSRGAAPAQARNILMMAFDGARASGGASEEAAAAQTPAGSALSYVEKGGRRYLQLSFGGKVRSMPVGDGGPRAPRVKFLTPDVLEVSLADKPFLVKLTDDNLKTLATMMEYLSDPDPSLTNLMLRGDMGTGKNTLVYTLAGLLGQGVRVMSFHAHSNEKDLRYRTTLGDHEAGETSRKHSELYEGAAAGDWVILDEPNKPLQIGILNSLNTILQNRRERLPGEDRPVTARPGFRAIALVNPQNRSYAVQEMPADFVRRFNVVDVDYMKPADEISFVMDTVFLGQSEKERARVLPVIEQIVGLANDIRSSYQQGHLPRPLSTRGVINMAWHLKMFPKDLPYFSEIFEPVYPTRYLEPTEKVLVDEYLRQHALEGKPRPANFKLPDVEIDRKAGVARLGNAETGVAEAPLGELKDEDVPESLRGIPHLQGNLRLWWALMKDRMLGRHSLVLGETGTGKTDLTGHLLYSILRQQPEEQTFTRQTRGQDITGKPELKNEATYWPPYPLERSIQRDTTWLVDEVTKPEDPGTVSVLNNVLQFGQIILSSGRLLNAGKGFNVMAMGTPARAQYEAQSFSGEVLDRFSTHVLDPLPAEDEVGLVQDYARRQGLDVSPALIESLQKALQALRKAYADGLLPVPPSVQTLYRVVSRLGRFPDTKEELVQSFLNAFPAWERPHEDVIRKALAPAAQAAAAPPKPTLEQLIERAPVVHKEDEGRFTMTVDGIEAELTYSRRGNLIIFTHTGVPGPLEGKGVGSKIVKFALDYSKAQGLKVNPACPFVSGYIRRHPEYQPLVKR